MGTSPLRRFLQSLCDNSCWNYAVFWKLQQQSHMVLTWEDGYFGTMKAQDSMENIFTGTSFGSPEERSSCNTYDGTSGGDAVELAVTYMSSFQYALGEGVVGDVAHTGNYRWVFAGSSPSGEFNTTLIPEHADEWLFQFAAGVKTILLVPVVPHGVLQFGSLEDLHEDAEIANYIKDEFFMYQFFMGYSDEQFLTQAPSTKRHVAPSCDTQNSLVSDIGPFLRFPKECELHKALGLDFTAISEDSEICNKDLFESSSKKDSKPCKIRGKSGAKQKKPRDRQLIQDRLKELRELVPDGAKCSIDGLLDRTITHMGFLKSVGDRAIKLRQCVQAEGMRNGLKNNMTPEVKDGQNGATFAFELGGDQSKCPILVEDLQYPGHMIIEMMCNESSRFLEIAEVIHGLDLTILKGVMERRSGNTWACFVIEAPNGFHRLDIFWPLMKLLQEQHSPISSRI